MAPSQKQLPLHEGQASCDTPEQYFSATKFTKDIDLSKHAEGIIKLANHHQELIYTDVPVAMGKAAFDHLSQSEESSGIRKHWNSKTRTLWIRIMPTRIHDQHQVWLRDELIRWQGIGLLTLDEHLHLRPFVGTTIEILQGPYVGSRKEPDLLIQPDNQRLPSFVVESGWTESYSRLLDDMNLWLVGGNGTVNATIILKWKRVGNLNRVEGLAELYTLDSNGMPTLRQRETVFPAPPGQQALAQEFHLTRRMLFGATVFPGRNPQTVLPLRLERLRMLARDALSLMGLQPA